MTLNPLYIMLSIYLISNSYALLKLQINRGFEIFGDFREVSQFSSALAYILQLFFLATILFFYRRNISKGHRTIQLGNKWAFFILVTSISFFLFNQFTGAGLAGSGFKFEEPHPLNVLFILLQPDLLVLLIAPFLASKRLFLAVLLVYFLSLIYRGWMGSVLLVFVLYLIRFYPVKMKLNNFIYFILFSVLIVFSLPALDALKWGMRSGMGLSDSLATLQGSNYWEVLGVVMNSVIERFQHLNYSAYITQNSSIFFKGLFSGDFLWFFQSGILKSIYCNIFGCSVELTTYTAEVLYDEVGLTWNVDPGLAGWASLLRSYSIIFILFTTLLLSISFYVFYRYSGKKGIILVSCFSLIYLFNGWLGAFYNFIFYAFIIGYFSRFSLRKKTFYSKKIIGTL